MFFVNDSDGVFFYGGERNLIAPHVAAGKMVATASRTFLSTPCSEGLESYADLRHYLGIAVPGNNLDLVAIALRLVNLVAMACHGAGMGCIFLLR
jgi:hypothetical protein